MWLFDGIMIAITIFGLIGYMIFITRKKPIEIDPKKMQCYEEHADNWRGVWRGLLK